MRTLIFLIAMHSINLFSCPTPITEGKGCGLPLSNVVAFHAADVVSDPDDIVLFYDDHFQMSPNDLVIAEYSGVAAANAQGNFEFELGFPGILHGETLVDGMELPEIAYNFNGVANWKIRTIIIAGGSLPKFSTGPIVNGFLKIFTSLSWVDDSGFHQSSFYFKTTAEVFPMPDNFSMSVFCQETSGTVTGKIGKVVFYPQP
jgi:hypothetical protein